MYIYTYIYIYIYILYLYLHIYIFTYVLIENKSFASSILPQVQNLEVMLLSKDH